MLLHSFRLRAEDMEGSSALSEAQRWIEAVTKKRFASGDFRVALEDGVLLCDLINGIKPGIIKRVNRLSTPIAGLDNVNVFLKACAKLGLKEAQLFHPGDLQDLSTRVIVKRQETNRRLKNVLITLFWLGKKAQIDPVYDGPYLSPRAFEGLLGVTLTEALELSASLRGSIRDSGFADGWYTDRENVCTATRHRREDSLDSLDSVGSRSHSTSSENTLKGSSEGFESDLEADFGIKMTDSKDISYRRSLVITPKATAQFNQFLPSKDKQAGYIPAPLRKKRAERQDDVRTEQASTFSRLLQRSSDSDGSKSLSDILTDETPTMMQQVRFEDLQKMRTMIKESEDKWQDDLTKWKNRRRSVNSDIVKKKEEREQIELLTSSGSPRKSKTFKEMQEEREMREQGISRNQSTDEDVFDEPVPRLRRIPPRSHTIDSLYTDLDKPDFSFVPLKRDEDYLAPDCKSFPTTDQTSPNTETSTSSSTGSRTSQDEANCNSGPTSRHSFNTPSKQTNIVGQSNTSKPKENTSTGKIVPEPLQPISTQAPEPYSGSFFKAGTVDTKPSGTQVSSYLPRSYQRSDSARITSVVAPRPFGVQSNRIASLPRAFTMDESYTKRFNGEAESSRKPAEPSRYAPFMTEDEARSQTSSVQSSNEDRDDEDEEETAAVGQTVDAGPSPVPLARVSPQPKAVTTPSPVGDKAQESYSDMRMILNQKPNRGYDFGFQANWDSTGAHVNVIQPGSSAELCHLQVGDEILSVNGHRVADMSYEQWKRCLEEAQKQGNLVMDIRRHGKNNWGRDLPSLPFKSHKTINLTSVDPLGGPDSCFSTNTVANSNSSSETTIKTLDVSNRNIRNQGSNGLNGGFSDELVPMRNKDSEPISLKNLKRRSEFFEQGGSESAISDLQVPSLSTSSNRWSWDPEEERRRQEKWQKEQERLLQEKYKRDQEKLDAEWQKAQQEAMKEGSPYHEEQEQKTLELDSRSISPLSPLSPTPFWDQQEQENEERRRKETEQRRQQEEEKRMKEEQQRLDKERRKREDEQHLQEEKRRKEEEARRLQKQKEEEEERRRLEREKEEELRRQEERDRLQQQDQWRVHSEVDSFSYTPVYSQLSFSHRAKSKSTPALDEAEKPEPKGLYGRQGGMVQYFLEEELKRKKNTQVRRQQAAVELEADRRQILNAMRYRNPERVVSSGLSEGSWSDDTQKKNQSHSQAELERQQILQEMKKKTQLLTDSSWIRQRETAAAKEPITLTGSMRRGESLDNLDMPRSSWRTSWTPGSTSSIPDYSRPYSTLSGSTSYGGSQRPVSVTLPTSQSMNSLRQSWSPSSSSTTNHLPDSRTQPSAPSQQQRNRAVSGKKICTFCDTPLGKGAAMVIESLGLCYHLTCFKCIDCKSDLGGSEAGAEVRIRNQQLYCNTCYVRFKSGQPTSM
ncbi:LIM domain only protein 7 isoform X14 [Denticeps clupeoides]|uniref:LIM domain only protein 7 isoform X14 n=1 Tax=Denticeps clupeoides TaxID=299321 RepID=UPI0010A3F0D8|nr:LIM domain only protein 7-like isoform X14 [Denticeps clupeoides]